MKTEIITYKPIATEKAVMLIESRNILTFEFPMKTTKTQIKKEIEEDLDVKVTRINTQLRANKKRAYVELNKKNPAIDVATKLGII